MTAVLRNPAGRVALAIFLSVLIHAAILWLPYIHLPQAKVQLPPLTVRLEPPSKPAELLAEKPQPAESPSSPAKSGAGTSANAANEMMSAMKKTRETAAIRPFPRHLQLTFIVYSGADGFRTGEIRQQFDIHDGRYALRSVRKAAGLTSLHNSDQLLQTSVGKIGEHGLQPELFEQEKITRKGTQRLQAVFDWTAQKLRYSDGNETALPEDAQDALSFMYQLSQQPMNGEFFPMPISDAEQLRQDRIEIGLKEDTPTPMGTLRTLHLRKMHVQGEAYYEIWLGLEYRLLPVKFSQVDSSGKTIEEFVISGIRAADE